MSRKWLKDSKQQTRVEEIGNTTTHAMGAILSVVALVLLVQFNLNQESQIKLISSVVFGITLLFMYLSSTIYHGLTHQRLKQIFRIVDHASIFLLIAGTYTPFMLVTLKGFWGWALFIFVWSLGVLGILFKIFFGHRYEILSVLIYLTMGWSAVVAAKPIYLSLSFSGLLCVVAGGVCYTIGVVFYAWERLKFSHMVWHLFVLMGSAFHFFAVLFYLG